MQSKTHELSVGGGGGESSKRQGKSHLPAILLPPPLLPAAPALLQADTGESESARLEPGPSPVAPGPLVTHIHTLAQTRCQTCRPILLSPAAPALTIAAQPTTLN